VLGDSVSNPPRVLDPAWGNPSVLVVAYERKPVEIWVCPEVSFGLSTRLMMAVCLAYASIQILWLRVIEDGSPRELS